MLKFLPLLLLAAIAYTNFQLSAWNLSRKLKANSTDLEDFRLEKFVRDIAKTAEFSQLNVRVFETKIINGLATPDGDIYITRGLLKKYFDGEVSAEEMASVIAHELGHVAMGHSKNRIADVAASGTVLWVLKVFFGRLVPFIGPWIASALAEGYRNRLSHINEYEADEYASALLTKSGIGTGPQKSLFLKLDNLTNGMGGTSPAWLLSHPKTAERIAAIEANEAKWGVAGTTST